MFIKLTPHEDEIDTFVCLECNWSHGKTYIGDNKIVEYSTKDRVCFEVCEVCVSAILDHHFTGVKI